MTERERLKHDLTERLKRDPAAFVEWLRIMGVPVVQTEQTVRAVRWLSAWCAEKQRLALDVEPRALLEGDGDADG